MFYIIRNSLKQVKMEKIITNDNQNMATHDFLWTPLVL